MGLTIAPTVLAFTNKAQRVFFSPQVWVEEQSCLSRRVIKESRKAKLASLGTALGESTFLIMVVLIHQFLGLFAALVGPFKSVLSTKVFLTR